MSGKPPSFLLKPNEWAKARDEVAKAIDLSRGSMLFGFAESRWERERQAAEAAMHALGYRRSL